MAFCSQAQLHFCESLESKFLDLQHNVNKIASIRWYLYRLPLRNSFVTAHDAMAVREGAIVEIITVDGITGCGEMAPMIEFGSNLADAISALPLVVPLLQGKTLTEALDFLYKYKMLPAATACGLEIALLDALGCTCDRSVYELLAESGASTVNGPQQVPINAVIGAVTTEDAVRQAQEAIDAGYSCIKLKVGSNPDIVIKRVAAVRQAIEPEVHLRLDANEAWTFEQARTILTYCAQFDIQYVEQPLAAKDLAGMRTLRRTVPIPIAADEAVRDLESVRRILVEEAADILIIKPQLVGGLHRGRCIIQEAAKCGVQCVVTSAIESGIGLASALHLVVASPEVTMECGLSTLHLLADDLLLDDLSISGGMLSVPTSPGLGVCLDRKALKKYSFDPRGL